MTLADVAPTPGAPPTHDIDDPRWETRVGLTLAAAFFVGLVGWAAFAPMDAAVNASGLVIVSGHRQIIQAADGGVLSALDVREGQHVAAGQTLVEFTPDAVRTEAQALQTQVIELQANLARLDAERDGAPHVSVPAAFSGLSPENQPTADQALALEEKSLQADYAASHARRGSLHARMNEAAQQINGFRRQLAANRRQRDLNEQELSGMKDLQSQGYAPMTRVRALEQAGAGLEGEAGAQTAAIGQLRASTDEARMQMLQGDNERAQQLAEERRRAVADLELTQPRLRAVVERLAHTQVRAPAAGRVIGLDVNTVGAVVAAGQRVMEIVPDDKDLVIEARVPARDAQGLRAGGPAKVRLAPGVDGNWSVVEGVLSRVSPDAQADERNGQVFFTVDVRLRPARHPAHLVEHLRPGAPAQLILPLRKRTALQYWLEPLTQSLWSSLHEP
jgi:HlyD family secretion protein